jgi:3-hydroxymyristoyl/3-hydroxydecanoyl-(acyl carrier protein) dehydratase
VTSTVDDNPWVAGPIVVPVAAPLRAVDHWRCEPDGDVLRMTARVSVRGDDPNLLGHFPGLAVFPGIFVIETLCQAVAIAVSTQGSAPPVVLRVVRSVRFLAPLLDGDQLSLDIVARPGEDGTWDVTAKGTRTDGTATAKIRAEFGPGTAERPPTPGVGAVAAATGTRDHVDVRAVLPQRHPLLLVDRVLELRSGKSIRTVKAVTGTEPCYSGVPEGPEHWRYDYPCSLMIESFGQSAALLWLDGREPTPDDDDQTLMFVGARDYSFHGSAHPGDVLRHEVRLESVVADTAFATGETWAGDRRIATVGTLIATRRPVRPSGSEPPARHAGTPSAPTDPH